MPPSSSPRQKTQAESAWQQRARESFYATAPPRVAQLAAHRADVLVARAREARGTRLAEARRELAARWDEESAARDSELAASHAREEDANEAYGDLVRAVDAERARWASERDARDAELKAERATWSAERAALVEAMASVAIAAPLAPSKFRRRIVMVSLPTSLVCRLYPKP